MLGCSKELFNLFFGKGIKPPCEEVQLVEINSLRIQSRQLQRIMNVLDKEQLGGVRRHFRIFENDVKHFVADGEIDIRRVPVIADVC